MSNPWKSTPRPVAIVGMACRFPGGASNPSKLWDLCAAGQNGWSEIPTDRFDVKSLYDATKERMGRTYVQGGYFLQEDIARFDAGFFNLPADVANTMDPQIRLLLEVVYEATEDAGIPIEKLAGSNTSVFSGCFGHDYYDMHIREPELTPASFATGTYTAMFANRISHFYNLQGPSMPIDTGCSSGLVALDQGCQTIRSGVSDVSIIGASNLILNQNLFIATSNLRMVSAEGKCYAWDARAEGYGRGEGVAVLILKSLDAAMQDGDHIHAVIRESGVNQDGKTTTITSPSMEAQLKLINACYQRADLKLSETGYVEAHMTGTQVGDAIEAEALAKTFGQSRRGERPVLVGSVKTNIGHLEPVSGLAAIVKTALALQYRQIPPNLNYEQPNPSLPLDEWCMQVPTVLTRWPQGKPLRASINNFGYGGTNAHVILEAPTQTGVNGTNGSSLADSDTTRRLVYAVSAKESAVCLEMAKNLGQYLRHSIEEGRAPSPSDLSYTLLERRSRLPWMMAVSASSLEELIDLLEKPTAQPTHTAKLPRLAFVFNGQGAQWYAMGRELLSAYPVFASAITNADEILRGYGATWSLYDELMRDEKSTRVAEINLSQPISVALQLCLVDLLRSWGINPSAVTSHSSGEIAAAYAVGALNFKEALGVVYFRGELALKYQKLSPLSGGMLAAGVGPKEAVRYIKDTTEEQVVLACINSPDSVTLSGDISALDHVASQLEQDGIFARKLKVPVAYHSHHMLPMAPEYVEALRSILQEERKGNPCIPFASPVTGTLLSLDDLTPAHWAENLTNPVRFSEAFESMCGSGVDVDVIVEIGAHSTLGGPIRQILKGRKIPYVSCLKRSTDAVETMQGLVCQLLALGYLMDVKSVNWPAGKATKALVPNLPSYPWNHGTRYWMEPRTSKETRYKKFPPHELLGLPLSGGTALTTTWRNFLRISELPWLIDHQVDGKIVLPGAAYVTMAIEAVRMLMGSPANIRGYQLRSVNILNGLTIPESSEGVEVHTSLRPCADTELDYKGWYEFEIGSMDSSGSWINSCHGFVSAQPENLHPSPLFREREAPHEATFFDKGVKIRPIDVKSIYATMRQMNIYHGDAFQNLVEARMAGPKTIAVISIPSVASETWDYIIHPTTLDTVIQAAFGGLPTELTQRAMVLPRSMGQVFVPANLARQKGHQLKTYTEMRKSDRGGVASNIVVSDSLCSPNFWMEDFYCQAVPLDINDGLADQQPSVCSKSRWELDVKHQIPSPIKDSMRIHLSDDEKDLEKKLRRAAYYFILDAVAKLKNDNQEEWAEHHKLFYNWMKHIVDLGTSGTLSPGSQSWSRASTGMKQMLNDELHSRDAAGQLTVRVGQQLVHIVRGEVTPLEVMMVDNLLNRYYMELPSLQCRTYKHLSKVVELYAFQNPGANVLEIGAGTGGATQAVLEAFGSRGDGSGYLLGHYTFTDVSAGFFEAARKKLAPWTSMLDFCQLDIEMDPAQQSFTPGSYDLIVASMVLHATKSLNKTLSNVRSLLKPGGRLVLIETTHDPLDMQLIFGTLPGWWLSEEPFRKYSPNVSLETWDNVLKDAGFKGVDFNIGDCEQAEFQSHSVIVATAVSPSPSYPSSVSIVYPATAPPASWVAELSKALENQIGIVPIVEKLDEVTGASDKLCIFAEMTTAFLEGINQTAFNQLKALLIQSRGLLWLSCGGLINGTIPAYGETQGLLRTLRQEYAGNRYVQLDFEPSAGPWSKDQIHYIAHVVHDAFDYEKEPSEIEGEYAVKNSMLYIPRVFVDPSEEPSQVSLVPQKQPFYQNGRPLVWELPRLGGLSNLHFTDQEDMSGPIPSGMVQIEAKAFGLNFRDVMLALGQLDDTLVGHECAGVITGLGPDTEYTGLKVGDRVCGISQGRFATASRAYATGVAKFPESLTWEDGAAIPYAYVTAYHSMIRLGGLRKGDSVLIHAAAGGVGQAAIVVAQHFGAELYVTCSTAAKRDLLVEKYQVDPARIFSSRDASFASAIMAATNGKGVDVVINSLAGPLLKATWNCVARFGRFIEIGKVDIEAGRGLDTTPFCRCAMYAGFDLLQLNEYSGSLTQEALTESIRICQERMKTTGSHPIAPIQAYALPDMEVAMRQMQTGQHVGKLVLIPQMECQVNVISRPRSLTLANSQATYLVVGGLGGIGRAITTWMIERGAKNIVLVSRSAEKHPDAMAISEGAKADGCNLLVRNCDVSNESALVEFLEHCRASALPPIRGVINSAMVLDDTILERMTFEQWQRAVQCKVSSSIHLHRHLPDLSFFVMLSSLAGVLGNVSQSNYAAGNTFQDTLARHRTALGLPAVSLNLSAVMSVGYVATEMSDHSNSRLLARVEALGTVSVDVDIILRLVEAAVLRPKRTHPDDAQVIVGLAPWDRLPEGAIVRQDRRFGTLRLASARNSSATGSTQAGTAAVSPTNMLVRALETLTEGARSVAEAVAARLAVIFNVPADEMDLTVPVAGHGVDSLVAVELRNWLSAAGKAKISIFEILQSNSLMELAALIVERSSLVKQQ